MSLNNKQDGSYSISFHPMWGIRNLGSCVERGSHFPLIHPNPFLRPCSRPSSARNCMPKHIPKYGFFSTRIDWLRGSISFNFSRFLMQSPKAPTPGNRIADAFTILSGSFVKIGLQPIASSAFTTDCTLPAP